jgi:hypothetical protein
MEMTINTERPTENVKPTKFVPIDQIDWTCTDPHPYDLIDWDNEAALPKRIGEDGREYLDIPIVPMTEEEERKVDYWAMSAEVFNRDLEDPENAWWKDL